MKPLRSLSGLVDFDCAARWGSFKLAVRELHKKPAAISQQVKQLEESVGFALFIRHRFLVNRSRGAPALLESECRARYSLARQAGLEWQYRRRAHRLPGKGARQVHGGVQEPLPERRP